eukprot:CAMPEP_0115322174 /NCGR_PEP_ID=MMETSP0270-20121206/81256_1 /TAXON_ID=71861 /ORGANISM="Scrippsiella trochoidea, Strain CCMP3099" /LENGTH=84 /DNA_ID=CAMNT_0002742111 /DNA_START=198 /DNA_END=453 /DNA_ORIENTATION=+
MQTRWLSGSPNQASHSAVQKNVPAMSSKRQGQRSAKGLLVVVDVRWVATAMVQGGKAQDRVGVEVPSVPHNTILPELAVADGRA